MKLPELDGLITDALRAANLGAEVKILMPQFPHESLPLIVAHQVPGGTAVGLGTVNGLVDVQCMASTRRAASDLARSAHEALHAACRARFSSADGYLGHMSYDTPAPAELRIGDPAPDSALFRFQFTCRITARSSL